MRKDLNDQIIRQKSDIEVLGDKLKTKIKEAVQEKIKSQLYDIVEAFVREKVEEKVRDQVGCFESRTNLSILISPIQLFVQIPEDLRQQSVEHRRQIVEIKTNLHNL